VLSSRLALGTVAVLALIKLVAGGSRWAGHLGGTLAPLLLGVRRIRQPCSARRANDLFPGIGVSQAPLRRRHGGRLRAATRASFSRSLRFELTGDYKAILPLSGHGHGRPGRGDVARGQPDEEKLTRRGLRVHCSFEGRPLRTVEVREVMSAVLRAIAVDLDVVSVASAISLHVALVRMFEAGSSGSVVDDGHVVGVCTPNDIHPRRAIDSTTSAFNPVVFDQSAETFDLIDEVGTRARRKADCTWSRRASRSTGSTRRLSPAGRWTERADRERCAPSGGGSELVEGRSPPSALFRRACGSQPSPRCAAGESPPGPIRRPRSVVRRVAPAGPLAEVPGPTRREPRPARRRRRVWSTGPGRRKTGRTPRLLLDVSGADPRMALPSKCVERGDAFAVCNGGGRRHRTRG